MRSIGSRVVLLLAWGLAVSAGAGEPLVVKTADGKYIPAAARGWKAAGPGSFRVLLKTGMNAPAITNEIKNRIAPIQVEAVDALTLVFRGPDLSENELLERLTDLPLGDDRAKGDALAALADLGSAGAPTMGDSSSAGSIRVARALEAPIPDDQRKVDPANLVGEIVGFEPCRPMPIFHLKIVSLPTSGEHQSAFQVGGIIAVRGYFKTKAGSKYEPDATDPRTRINLNAGSLPLGTKVFGKPFRHDPNEWVFETIEPL